jgi:hypothetical protein
VWVGWLFSIIPSVEPLYATTTIQLYYVIEDKTHTLSQHFPFGALTAGLLRRFQNPSQNGEEPPPLFGIEYYF